MRLRAIDRPDPPRFGNEGRWDRVVRLVIGLAMLYLGWAGAVAGLGGALLKVFGLVPVVTALLGWDPIYAIFDLDTTRGRRSR